MITENLKLSGQLNIVLKDAAGNIKDEREVKNLVVTTGLGFIASRIVGTSKGVMSHMALGSSTQVALAGQTDLSSILGNRLALASSTITGSGDIQIAFAATFGAGDGTGAVTEAGIFNANTGGDMLCRTVFSVVNKSADDTISITWTVTIAAS